MKVETDIAWAVILFFLFFWGQSGWYRIDCVLGVAKACALIASEYDRKAKP